MGLVRIGKVVRAIGLRVMVGVAGSDGALEGLAEVALETAGGATERRRVEEARRQGRVWAVKLGGVGDRTEAEKLIGSAVLAEREALGDAGEGLHFWGDLEGLPVETVTGQVVGRVTGLYETGAADVLVVTGRRGEVLIPLAPYVSVDRAAGKVVVDPPDGLLDLEVSGEEEEKGGPERGE